MKTLLCSFVFALAAQDAFAGYGVAHVDRYFVDSDGWVYFGTTTQLPGTCTYFIEHFRFSSTSAGGKGMLATVIAAKVANSPLAIWYSDSSVPGATHANGCSSATMAVVGSIGIR